MEMSTTVVYDSVVSLNLPAENQPPGVQRHSRSESPLTEDPETTTQPNEAVKPKRKPRKRKNAKPTIAGPNEIEGEEKPARPTRKRKTVKTVVVEEAESVMIDEKPKRQSRKRKAISAVTAEDEGNGEAEEKPKKKRRRKTPEENKVYTIPPIENVLSTTFKGRLGYACLNSVLRSYSTPIFCSRTCRLSTLAELGPAHVRALALQNVADLHTLVRWNAAHGIRFMRMSSEMFPFASHPVHGYRLDFADSELREVGATARGLGMRLTSHPGQFTQLGSPRENVVANAIRDLEYHCELMDRMGLDQDSIMMIHMGGAYGDKPATIERFKEVYARLPDNVKARLVLENDELCYNVDDLLPVCRALHIPLVFDYHHDWIFPSARPASALIPEINALWHAKGIRPKQHYSEPRPGAQTNSEKRAHSDRVARLPADLPDDMDLMLECKDKEQAVFYLYRLYGLHEVDARVLRPPAAEENLHTRGRKSHKRVKAKAADPSGAGDGVDAGIAREAEEHGVPLGEAAEAAVDGLDCGSGDEEPVDVSAGGGNQRQKRPRSVRKQKADNEGEGVGANEAARGRKRRKTRGNLKA